MPHPEQSLSELLYAQPFSRLLGAQLSFTNLYLDLAAFVCLIAFFVHTFVGERFAARPLLACEELPRPSKWLNFLCWHIVTVHLLILACWLGAAAFGWVGREAVLLIAMLTGTISLVSIAVTLKAGIAPYRFPASYMLGLVAALSFAALSAGLPG